jgi:Ca2+-binding EF-hand superfamily protein
MSRLPGLLQVSVPVVMLCAATFARAEGESPKPGGPNREQMLARFDTNGDGQLNEQERAAAKAAFGDRPAGQNPNGQKPDGQRPNMQEMLQRFDADGDGQLNAQEKAAAQQALQNFRSQGGGPKGPVGAGNQLSPEMRARLIQQFDRDGDGQLNLQEQQAAMQHLQQLRSQMGQGGNRPAGKGPAGNRPPANKPAGTGVK